MNRVDREWKRRKNATKKVEHTLCALVLRNINVAGHRHWLPGNNSFSTHLAGFFLSDSCFEPMEAKIAFEA